MGFSSKIAIGAAVVGGAMATDGQATPTFPEMIPQTSTMHLAPTIAWFEGEDFYFTKGGSAPERIVFTETPESQRLRQLMQGATRDNPMTLPDNIILVGGGGCGTPWGPLTKPAPGSIDNGPPGDGSEPLKG